MSTSFTADQLVEIQVMIAAAQCGSSACKAWRAEQEFLRRERAKFENFRRIRALPAAERGAEFLALDDEHQALFVKGLSTSTVAFLDGLASGPRDAVLALMTPGARANAIIALAPAPDLVRVIDVRRGAPQVAVIDRLEWLSGIADDAAVAAALESGEIVVSGVSERHARAHAAEAWRIAPDDVKPMLPSLPGAESV